MTLSASSPDSPAVRTVKRGAPILLVGVLLLSIWQVLKTSEDEAPPPPAVIATGTDLAGSADPHDALPDPIRLDESGGWEPGPSDGLPPREERPDDVDFDASDVGLPPAEDGSSDDTEEAYGLGAPPPVLRPRGVERWPGRMQRDETGGRVNVPEAAAWIGTPTRWVAGATTARRGRVPEAFAFEAPRHVRSVGAFTMDLYEVTNAQYRWFLQLDARIDVRIDRRLRGTLEEIAEQLVVRDVPENIDWEHVTRQLYETNRPALHAAHPALVVIDPITEVVQVEATFRQFREAKIRTGTLLTFFTRAPPGHWPRDTFPLGEGEHPVRFLSFEEAQAFAHWAGKHLPTEFEWEYAARGEKGLAYPWGGRSNGFEERVNGGLPLGRGETPATVPFNALPGGASWIGCFNMLGNVAEWTSSFLAPYPDSDATHPDQGRVMVVRGGSAADEDSLRVRPAFRGWREPYTDPDSGGVIEFTPYPRRRLPWVGFRCAVYPEPARSRLPEMQYQVAITRVLPPGAIALDRYSGAEAKELLPSGTAVEAGLFVPKRAFAVTSVPFERVALPTGGMPAFAVEGPHAIRSNVELFAETDGAAPILFGMIQTDFPIMRLLVAGGGLATPPKRLHDTDAPAGHYIVGLVHDHLALITPDLSVVYYLSPGVATSANVSVLENEPPVDGSSPVSALQRVEPVGGGIYVELRVPLGGGAKDGHVVLVRFRYNTVRGAMRAVELPWLEHPAR